MCVASFFVYALEPIDKPILTKLALIPSEVRSGEVWRIFTWPLANGLDQQLLWVIVSIAVLWYFGSRLEEQVGRVRFAWYLLTIIVIPGLVGTALDLPQAGIHTIQLIVLLTFIAEYPNVRFFFGIPAWVLGGVYVAAEFLQLLGDRAGRNLMFFVVSLFVAVFAARAWGMLEATPGFPRSAFRIAVASRSAVVGRQWSPVRGPEPTPTHMTRPSSTICSTRSVPRV